MKREISNDEQIIVSEQNIKEKNFWLKTLSGDLFKTGFPYDNKENIGKQNKADVVPFEWTGHLYSRLMEKGGGSFYKFNVIVMSAIILTLGKYTGSSDIIVSTPIYKPESEGKFINTVLPVRIRTNAPNTFKELLKGVSKAIFEASENQNFPIKVLLDRIGMPLREGEPSLLDTAVIVQNIHDPDHIRPIKPKVIFSFTVTEKAIKGELEYPRDLYKKSSMEQIIKHLERLLERGTADLDSPLFLLDELPDEDKDRILREFNKRPMEYVDQPRDWQTKSIPKLFEEQVERTPDNIAVIFTSAHLTYRELNEMSNQLAFLLRSKGVLPETAAAVRMENSIELITAILGILKAGGAYLSIHPDYPEERIKFIMADNNAQLLITTRDFQDNTTDKKRKIYLPLNDGGTCSVSPPKSLPRISFANLACITYTPGTAGKPKGVMVEHRNISNLVRGIDEAIYKKYGENLNLCLLFPCMSGDSLMQLFGALLTGQHLYIAPKNIPMEGLRLYRFFQKYNIDISDGTPVHIALLAACEKGTLLELNMKHFIIGGGRLHKETTEAFLNRFGMNVPKITNRYGIAECCAASTIQEISVENINQFDTIPIGKPLLNQRVYIVDRQDRLVSIGMQGELHIAGSGVARGCGNRPGLNAERFVEDTFFPGEKMYRTGDLGRWLPDGTIEFLGRTDCRMTINGNPIEIETIERQLLKHGEIEDAAVIVKRDENKDNHICSYFVSEKEPATSGLREYLSCKLPAYLIPGSFVHLEKMPLTFDCKIDRNALSQTGDRNENRRVSPVDIVEEKLTGIWAEVLEIEKNKVCTDSDFHQSGGQSLQAIMLSVKVHKEFDISIPIPVIFELATIKRLAEYIRSAKKVEFASIEPAEEKEYYVLSPAQKRLYFLQKLDVESISYNVPQIVELEGELHRVKLENAVKHLLERHEALRTSFEIVEDVPVQKIHREVEFPMEYWELRTWRRSDEDRKIINAFIRPFDLSRAPLIRLGLIKREEAGYILMVDRHHIISDAASREIFLEELIRLYDGTELAPLKLQYKDYSEWRNHEKQIEAAGKQEAYWLKQFEEEIPVLELFTDFPRPRVQSFEGRSLDFIVSKEEAGKLKEIAVKKEATLFMLLLAVYNIFLAKISAREDIVIGTPIVGRGHADLENIMGVFINTLALRNYSTGEKTFFAFLEELRNRTLNAFENQDYPFEDLVDKVVTDRDISRNPLFDALFTLHSLFDADEKFSAKNRGSLEIKPYAVEGRVSIFDIYIDVIEAQDSLYFSLQYCTNLFRQETVSRFISYFKNIVFSVIENPGRKISTIEVITPKEKKKLLFEFNDTRADWPGEKTLHQLFEEEVDRSPGSTALIYGEHQITYLVLNRKVNHLARYLRLKGAVPDGVVGLMVKRSIEMVIGMLAVLKAGSAYLPIDPHYPDDRKRYMIDDSFLTLLLTNYDQESKWNRKPQEIEIIELRDKNIYCGNSNNPAHVNDVSNLAYVIYTSGSTGKPKGVMLEHRNLVNLLIYGYKSTHLDFSSVLQFSTISFDASFHEIFSTLLAGGKLSLIDEEIRTNFPKLFKIIEKNRIKTVFFPISLLKTIFSEENYIKMFPRCIDHIQTAGDQVVVSDRFKRYLKENNIYLHNHYGPSETHVVTTFTAAPLMEIPELPPIGKPIANTGTYILDKYGNLQPVGVPGELYIEGMQVGRGYLNNPGQTSEKFRALEELMAQPPHVPGLGNTYRTGDLCRWMPDANIEFLGRIDHQAKIRGFRVELGEIETHLLNHEAVREAVVLVKATEKGDKYLCAYIVSHLEDPASELRNYLLKRLPEYMVPSYFIPLEKIPLTPNGKIDRKALTGVELKIGDAGRYCAPGNMMEKKLVEIWSEILGIEKNIIGIDANFFELGGHSLSAAILASKIHKTLNIEVPLGEIFRKSTVRVMAEYISHASNNKYIVIKSAEEKEYYALSSAQKRLYFIQQMAVNTTTYNMPLILPFDRDVDKNKLESAFRSLIARHESLRTSFVKVNEIPVQKIHDHVEFDIQYYDLTRDNAEMHVTIEEVIRHFIRPFDLSQAPLIRSGLIKLPGNNHAWTVDIHHIISDGTSKTILSEDFISLYNGEELGPLHFQYKDFSEWQNRFFESDQLKAQEDYWLELISGEIPRLNLPADNRRPEVFTFAGDSFSFMLGGEDIVKFKELSSKNSGTLYMNLLAALNALFYKYTGQTDIIIGSSFAGRKHAEFQHIVGMFINTLPTRNYPKGEKTYEAFLKETITQSIKYFENQDLQFEELVDRLETVRDPSRNPVFDICIVVQNFRKIGEGSPAGNDFGQIEELPLAENTLPMGEYKHTTSKFDMTFFIQEFGDDVHIDIEYYTGIFEKSTIKRLSLHFGNVVKMVSGDPSIKLKDIEIISEEEKQQVLYAFNDTDSDYPKNKTLHQLFEEQVEKTPDRTAVVSGDRSLSFRELDVKANQLACYLSQEKGIRPDQPVGILIDRSIFLIAAILGILKAGGAYVPIDPSAPEARNKSIIEDAGVGIVISRKKYIKTLNRLQWECSCFHTFVCMDSTNVHQEEEVEKNELMDEKLWNYVGSSATDEITGGGWISSYTGEPFRMEEMEEYGDNILEKLTPLLHKEMRVLEIGCASGLSMYRIAPMVGFYLGTDISPVIIEKNKKRVAEEGYSNIALRCLPAHEIHRLVERDFDLIILNSVIQSFHGHNYLRDVTGKCIDLLADKGHLFFGDIMDHDLKDQLVRDLAAFKQGSGSYGYKTKTDWSSELFVSRLFFEDLAVDIPGIRDVEFSDKIHTIENELTKFRYDALLRIEKNQAVQDRPEPKRKHQHDLSHLNRLNTHKPMVEVKPRNLAYIIYTSGTTGRPKGVMIEHRSLVNYLAWGVRQYLDGDHHYIPFYTSMSFDLTVTSIYLPLISGSTVDVYENDQPGLAVLDVFKRGAVDIVKATPSHLKLVRSEIEKGNARLKKFIVGGEEFESMLARDICGLFRHEIDIYNEYGPTEATVGCMIYRFDYDKDRRRTIPIGVPVANARIYILDRYLKAVPINAVGEIYIGGDTLARGYINLPGLTAEKFTRDPFAPGERMYRTGDLARHLPTGNIEYLGRVDNQVKIRGYRIEIQEIENQLLRHNDLKEAVVVFRAKDGVGADMKDESSGYLCCYWVPAEGRRSLEASEIMEYLSGKLPNYMIPSYFVRLENIPLTPNGKVDRKALPGSAEGYGDERYATPRNRLDKILVDVWSDVLGIEKRIIGIHSNFFELGGHSLKATILVSKIHKELNVKLPLAEVFKSPTIKGISAYISSAGNNRYMGIEPVEKKEYYALSSAQKRLYFLQQLDIESTSYNMPMVLPLGGDIEKDRFESIIKQLIDRHESLRTSFVSVNETPVQKVHKPEIVEFSMDYYEAGETEAGEIVENYIRPFDLHQPPLIRSGLIKLPDNNHIWIVDLHHIISDGTSQTILSTDFITLYEGNALESQNLRIQYKDFSQWQNRLFETGAIRFQEEYWLELYSGDIPRLHLPTDYERPEIFTFVGDRFGFTLEKEDASKFRGLGAANGATLYMNFLAALNTLFYKYTGQTDIIIGTGVAGRPHVDLQQVVGMFVNTLAVRNCPEGEKTYEGLLKEVVEHSVAAFENQDVQFEELVDKLELQRDTSRTPLFDITMLVQNFRRLGDQRGAEENTDQIEVLPRANEELPLIEYRSPTSKVDLTFFIHEVEDDIFIAVEFYTAIFKETTVRRFTSHLMNVIKKINKEPSIKLKDIEIISEEEKQRVLYELSGTLNDSSMDKTFIERFEEQVEKTPGNVSVIYNGHALTYEKLNRMANRLSHYLYYGKGVRPDDRVGILMSQPLNIPVSIVGILKSGAAYVPIDPLLPLERVKYMIREAGIEIVISEKRYVRALNRLQWECEGFHSYVCLDSSAVHEEDEFEKSELMNAELWNHVGETAVDDITGGGWMSSYTGKPMPREEMDEYGDNILKKVEPLLHPRMRVLEIGCASGISMFRIAPKVGFYYGTDLSRVIIEKNEKKVREEGYENIKLSSLAAHEVKQVGEREFDLIIINSVIQAFHGHNYLRKVIKDSIDLLGEKGYLFVGDVLDQEKKDSLVRELVAFKNANRDKDFTTKTDFPDELFVAGGFWEDLAAELPVVEKVEFSDKIYTIENELTKFRYDTLISIDKRLSTGEKRKKQKKKHQDDRNTLITFGETSLDIKVPPATLAYIVYTSGSTGAPKGAAVEHKGLANYTAWRIRTYGYSGRDVTLQLLTYSFDGFASNFYSALLSGGKLVMISREKMPDYEYIARIAGDEQVTGISLVPAMYEALLHHSEAGNFKGLRFIVLAGEKTNPVLAANSMEMYPGVRLINEYGPTETTVAAAANIHMDENSTGVIGRPIDNVLVYILDSGLNPQPVGIAGELCISGIGVGRGYLNNIRLTADKFLENHFIPGSAFTHGKKNRLYRTGDLGRWMPDGTIEFLGRMDQQVKIRGFRIEPGEVENCLCTHDEIKEAVVLERNGESGEKYLCAYIVPYYEGPVPELREYLLDYLPDYMVPSRFIYLEQIPLTPHGKIDRNALPGTEAETSPGVIAPGNELEEKLLAIWAGVLGIEKKVIGIDSNFFELGGHSIKATILAAKVHKELNVKLPIAEVFRNPTVRGLAGFIGGTGKNKYKSIASLEKKEYYDLSYNQEQLWILSRLNDTQAAYNIIDAYVFEKLDPGAFERAFVSVVNRHEILRTVIITVNGEPKQVINDYAASGFKIDYIDLRERTQEHRQELVEILSREMERKTFNLEKGPMLSAKLLHVEEQQHIFLMAVHHIISDGWSVNILVNEIKVLYNAYAGGEANPLPPLSIQYKEFAAWQKKELSGESLKEHQSYWLDQFRGEIPILHLPTDFPRPSVKTFHGGSVPFQLDEEISESLARITRVHNAGLLMSLTASVFTLLFLYSGQEDIVIGVPVSGRGHSDLEAQLGFYVNTLALRTTLSGNDSFEDLLIRVVKKTLASFEHQIYPFNQLVEGVNCKRDRSRSPLFDVMLQFVNFEGVGTADGKVEEKMEGVFVGQHLVDRQSSKFDLVFNFFEAGNQLYGRLIYNADLFEEDTIAVMIERLKSVLRQITLNPRILLKDIDVVKEIEKVFKSENYETENLAFDFE